MLVAYCLLAKALFSLRIIHYLLLIVTGIVLTSFPFLLSEVTLNLVTEISFFALFAVSYNLLLGYAGLLSFGHAAFFGVGAYFTVFALKYIDGIPLLFAILIAGLAGASGGALVGFFCVRLHGAYFSLLTLAFNQFLFAVALKWRSLTGGDDGIGFSRPDLYLPLLGKIDMVSTVNVYYLTITLVLLCLISCRYFLRTPFGNTIRCVKENEERATFIGYNVFLSKLLVFTIAGFFAGIAGSLFAIFQEFVSLDTINLTMSTEVLFMTFIGGVGSFFGPVLGAAVYIYFIESVSRITTHWQFFLGLLFIFLILFAHKGLIGLVPSFFISQKGTKHIMGDRID